MNEAGKFDGTLYDGQGSHPHGHGHVDSVSTHAPSGATIVPDAHLLFSGDYHKSGHDLIISDDLHRVVVPNYFHGDKRPALVSPEGAPLDPKVIDALTGHTEYAQAGTAPVAKLVGHVAKMTGSASIVRNGVTIDLQNGDAVYQSDVVQTGSGSTLGLVLSDGTTFNLSANARLMLNDLTFDATSTSNSALFTLVQGAASFVAGQIAKTGDMKIGTPVATMGIRGTAVILDISSIDGTVSISVVDQHDGTVHAVQVFNAQGIQIGTVTSNGTSLTLTPAANFNVIAQESNKTPAQIAQEFIAFQAALDTYNVQKAIDPNLPQHTDNGGNNANPQQTKFASGSPPANSPYTESLSPTHTTTTPQHQDGGSTPQVVVLNLAPTAPTGTILAPAAPDTLPPKQQVVEVATTPTPFVVTPPTVAPITSGAGNHTNPVMSASGDVVYDPDGIIYFYDRASGATTRVTPAGDGFTYSGQTISSDGRYVAYQGTDGTHTYVYVWGTDPADVAHYHVQSQLVAGSSPAISGDGSTVLVEQAGGSIGIYDLQGHSKGTITPASVGVTGALSKPAISADGHVIAFWNSDSAISGGSGHLYTYNVSSGVVTEIANTISGAGNIPASISADGHYVVYQSQAPGGHTEISMVDLATGQVVYSTANAHEILAGDSKNPVISPDGHFIIFTSTAELTPGDTNSYADTYVVDVTNPAAPVYTLISEHGDAPSDSGVAISAGGLFVAFGSAASFYTGSTGGNIFVADPTSGRSAIIEETAGSPDHLTASGVIGITGGSTGVTLSVTDRDGHPTDLLTVALSTDGQTIQWNFSEAKSDFASLQYGQDLTQQFLITLNYPSGTTTVSVVVGVHDAVQPVITHVDVAPVANPVTLADDHGNGAFVITPDVLLAHVGDIDGPSLSITDVSIKSGGGSLVHENGTWTYTPTAGFHGEVVFNYTASDGTLTSSSTANLSVVNDPATIDGVSTGNVVEDTSTTAGGKLTVHDIDPGEAIFQPVPVAALTGTYGNFTFDQISGSWNYALVHDKANGLAEGQVVHDTLTVTSADGTASQVIDVTITGTDDAPVATPVTLADGHGDGSYTITTAALLAGVSDIDSATLSITDVTIKNGGGALVHNQDGTWTYTPDPGFHGEVVFDYTASDGTLAASSTANLDIVNDPATITGQGAGSVVEDTSTTAAGTLTVHDIDPGEAVFQQVPAAALTGHYGNFTFDANTGAWTYALVHNKADGLSEGQVVHDTLTVTSADGTASQTIDVTVTGTNDAPVITAGTVASGNIDVPFAATAHNTLSTQLASELHTSGLISGLPGESGFGTLALGPSDDESSGAIDITSVFGTGGVNFFGHHYTSLYINNNGNITFDEPTVAFTPTAIDGGLNNPIIAAFWADVDTRGHGTVSYDLDAADGVMTITWDHVGYYSEHTNRLDTFQLVLINEGSGNFDIEYRYGNIQWTTGDASYGSNGLGGIVARAGYSAGDGSHYFEIPQSGNQSALLSLSSTPGNTGIAGVDHLEVRNGEVGPSTLTSTGTIDFSDPNLNDTHSIQSVTYTGSGTELGTLALVRTTDTTGTGTGGQFVWTYTADPATVKAALDGTASHSKVETFDVVISDGHDGGTVTQTVSVTLAETGNHAPVVSGAVTGTATEDGSPSALDALANASDADHDALSVVTLPAQLPVGVSYDPTSHLFTLDPSVAAYQPLAAGATTTVTVDYGVSDGHVTTPGSVSWTVTGINDPPSFAGSDLAPTYQTGSDPVTLAGNVSVSDVDNANFAGGSLRATVTAGGHEGDTLIIAGDQYISLDGNIVMFDADGFGGNDAVAIGTLTNNINSLTIALNGNADDAAVAALARTIEFENTKSNPDTGTRTVTFTLNDGGGTANGGQDTAFFTTTVNVTSPHVAPVLDSFTLPIDPDGTALYNGIFTAHYHPEDGSSPTPSGLAISAVNADPDTQGVWQYYGAGGWHDITPDSVSLAHALVLNYAAEIRFVPVDGYAGTPSLTAYAVDTNLGQNQGSGFTYIDVTQHGGSTDISDPATISAPTGVAINEGPQTASVADGGTFYAAGQFTVSDTPDAVTWSIDGGSPVASEDYQYAIDNFKVVKGSTTIFNDHFTGTAPPSGPNFLSGSTPAGGAYSDAGGTYAAGPTAALLEGSNATVVGTSLAPDHYDDAVFGQFTTLLTGTSFNSAPNQGLRSGQSFSVNGLFDLTTPEDSDSRYGIRLSDRVTAAGDNSQPGTETVDLGVVRNSDGTASVVLYELNYETGVRTLLDTATINRHAGDNEILLSLSNSADSNGLVHASFTLEKPNADGVEVADGAPVTLSAVGHIFDNEDWTRAQFYGLSTAAPSSSPQADSVLQGTYGTLDLAQNGTWQYFLNPGLPSVKALGPGETAHDNFQVTATATDGAHSSQTISINVSGPPLVTVTVQTPEGLDFQAHNALREMGAGTIQPGNATSFTILNSTDDREFVIDGSNFTYSDGQVTGGTITSFHEFKADGSTALADFTGLAVDAVSWIAAVQQAAAGDHSAIEALTSKYSYEFIGGTGSDSFGSAGHNDLLIGGAGDDTLDPGGAPASGHDTVTGGAGSDTIIYQAGYGALTITDFDQGNNPAVFNPNEADHIQLNGLTAPLSVSYTNGNAILDFGNNDIVTLLHVSQSQYEALGGSEFTNGNTGGNNGNGPVVSGADNTVAYTGTPVSLDQSVAVTDTTGTVTSVNVWISSGFQNGDSLSIDGWLDGDLFNPNDGSTIHYHYDNSAHGIYLATTSGTATLDDFDSALHLIQFWNAGSDPSAGGTDATRTVTWAAQDAAGATSPTATTTINVDDAPVIHFDNIGVTQNGEGATTVAGLIGVTQNSQGTTTITGLSVTDADAAAAENLTLTATTAGATSGTTVSPASPSGHLSDINATLQSGLTYDQGPTPTPTDMVTLTVADGHGATDTVHLIFNVAQNPAEPVTLAGTTGKDVFFGTGYQDQFVFAANSNHDTIMNFTPGQDHIDLSAVVTNSDVAGWFSQHVTVSPTNPSDELVSIDAADTIVLHGVSAASLTYHDFILHPGGGGGIN